MTEFQWKNSLCVSGDRNGGVAIWDINTGTPLISNQMHSGAVAQIHMVNGLIFTSGLRDGTLKAIDMR